MEPRSWKETQILVLLEITIVMHLKPMVLLLCKHNKNTWLKISRGKWVADGFVFYMLSMRTSPCLLILNCSQQKDFEDPSSVGYPTLRILKIWFVFNMGGTDPDWDAGNRIS